MLYERSINTNLIVSFQQSAQVPKISKKMLQMAYEGKKYHKLVD